MTPAAAAALAARGPFVPRHLVAEHVADLRARGMGYRRIAAVAGLQVSSLRNAAINPSKSVRRPDRGVRWATAYKILRVNLDPIRVPTIGPGRRLRALRALGYDQRRLATETGLSVSALDAITHGRSTFVRLEFAQAITAVFDRLSMTSGPSLQSVTRARKAGWPPPLAWDDIDDPTEVPDAGIAAARLGVQVEDIEWLLDAGERPLGIAARLGVLLDSLERTCYRAARHDLAHRLHTANQVAA